MRSSTWSITFGDYDLSIDRRTLTLTLTEAKTDTAWGTDIPLGWMEVQERATGATTRHEFGTMQQLTVSEKAGPQGKRILWGLDLGGIPVDLYVITTQREIQMVVEANRDSRTHRVAGFGLVPGLCRVPEGDGNFRLLPLTGGTSLSPSRTRADVTAIEAGKRFHVWDALAMPFLGAVRQSGDGAQSALGLFTDSAYAEVTDDGVSYDFVYRRDPERRRLDLRVLVFPHGDAVSVARAYREKQIATNNHVTLRRKLRDNPALEPVLGKVLLLPRGAGEATVATTAMKLESIYGIGSWGKGIVGSPALSPLPAAPLRDHPERNQTRWDELEDRLQMAKRFQEAGELVAVDHPVDWAAIATDFWRDGTPRNQQSLPQNPTVPLLQTIYHDSVVPLAHFHRGSSLRSVLRALLHAASPAILLDDETTLPDLLGAACAILAILHRSTFSSFLTGHRFLTPDSLVEETLYSDRTRIVVNQSKTDTYESDDLTLPPLGFYVRHTQFEAHDALRVGTTPYEERCWRIAQSLDGKPLQQSAAVRRQEFTVPEFPDETDEPGNPLQ